MSRDEKKNRLVDDMKKYHRKGVGGDKKAVQSAYGLLRTLREDDPENALLEAYYGSVQALLARDAEKPLAKADLAEAGLQSLHRAVAMDPDNKEIRLIRAHVCMRLPDSYFRCAATALEDFRYLYAREKESPGYLSKSQKEEVKKCIKRLTREEGPR